MGELDENQQARLFDALLSDAEKWNTAPRAQARRAADTDDVVAEDLSLIVSLREVRLPRSETEFARARVGQRLANMMQAEPGPPPVVGRVQSARAWLRAVTAPPARAARVTAPQRPQDQRDQRGAPAAYSPIGATLRRAAAFAAVAMVAACVSLAGASVASAHALPESPLYGVKRAEETTLLALAWNDESKGQTLAMIANHRLTEAAAEADQRRNTEARALLGEFDTAMGKLIDLTAHAQAIHEDSSDLASAVQATLEAERNTAAQAAAHGETAFAEAANASMRAAKAHIQQAGIELPGKSGQNNGNKGSGQNNGKGSSQGSNSGRPTPPVSVTPGATHTPHTGQSNGSGG